MIDMQLTFREWLILLEADDLGQARSHAYLKANPKNPDKSFLVIYGNTIPIKDKLKEMGFRYFQGTWSTGSEYVTPEKRSALESLGVDFSAVDQKTVAGSPASQTQAQTHTDPVTPLQASNVDKMLGQMQTIVKNAIDSDDSEQNKQLMQNIEKQIQNLANSTDETSKSEFIKKFLEFSSKFYQYSFANQMLIWIQTAGKAIHVASASNWQKLGRTVVNWKNPIRIYAPSSPRKITREEEDPVTGEKQKVTYSMPVKYFKMVSVYDVSSTEPIPGVPENKVFNPMSRKDWSIDTNEDIEELNALVNATLEFIKENNINFDYEELDDEVGGYSAGGTVRINNKFKGINAFSTIVHELAHELLHHDKNTSKESSRQEKEIDAESTAYIVLHHFGFETKDSPRYLALWRSSGEKVRERSKHISNAAKQIIIGIKNNLQKLDVPVEDENEV